MELKDQVCTLEQAKRLKELGVTEQSLWRWVFPARKEMISTTYGVYHYEQAKDIIEGNEGTYFDHTDAPAYTVAELGEMLPDMLTTNLQYELVSIKEDDCWLIRYVRGNNMLDQHPNIKGIGGETEAQARAAMLIYMLENSLIKP